MSDRRLELHGELTFTIEAAAECYRVEAAWVEQVRAAGFFARGERSALAEADLDRLARILRWHRHLGLDLETVMGLLID